jgi:hypothetical protein
LFRADFNSVFDSSAHASFRVAAAAALIKQKYLPVSLSLKNHPLFDESQVLQLFDKAARVQAHIE